VLRVAGHADCKDNATKCSTHIAPAGNVTFTVKTSVLKAFGRATRTACIFKLCALQQPCVRYSTLQLPKKSAVTAPLKRRMYPVKNSRETPHGRVVLMTTAAQLATAAALLEHTDAPKQYFDLPSTTEPRFECCVYLAAQITTAAALPEHPNALKQLR
jgi:hypothetical protein